MPNELWAYALVTGARTGMALTRSENMSRIRGKDTSPERIIRRRLWAAGLRYRLQAKTPGGRADLVVPGQKLAIFIDGCFWHGCPEHYVRPRSRNEFWDAKLAENVSRDRRQTLLLDTLGWRVVRVWEHEVHEAPEEVVGRILADAHQEKAPRRYNWRVARVELLDSIGDLERRHLEDLRDGRLQRIEERRRTTKKLGRVRSPRRSRSGLPQSSRPP